jgi:hypothetical protein
VNDSLIMLLETYGFEAVAYGSGIELLVDPWHRRAECLIVVPTILIGGRLNVAITVHANKLAITAVLDKPLAVARFAAPVPFVRKTPGYGFGRRIAAADYADDYRQY